MSDEPPFKVGDRVRMTLQARRTFRGPKGYSATVRDCYWEVRDTTPSCWVIRIRRDGYKCDNEFAASFWEAIPEPDLTLDDVAQSLADAVKRGDTHAALALADRVFELVGGTPSAQNPH